MSFDHSIAVFSTVIAVLALVAGIGGFVTVILQLRDAARQRESESLVEIFDINRQLLSLGFAYPHLFAIVNDAEHADPVLEGRYLQLWLNQFSLIRSYLKHSVLRGELKENLERDLSDFMTMQNMRRHGQCYGTFFPPRFRQPNPGATQSLYRPYSIPSFRPRDSVWSLVPGSSAPVNKSGIMSSVKAVEVRMPKITTVANGLCNSAP